jgi:protease_degS: periplasmic serine peptidase DegS
LKDGSSKLGLGTGLIVTDNGYILTNAHVSGEKYSTCYVTLETGEVFTGNVVWSDMDVDLAILKISAKNLIYAKLGDSDNIKVGEKVYAIGNPIGFEFERTVTSGIISAIDRTIKIEEEEDSYMSNLIQTDATINLGNSGGPLINIDGEVVGINTLKITSAEGISFAVPINLVKTIIEKFATQGKFEEASIGIFAYDKNVIPYIDNNLKFNTGIYVVQIDRNSSAYNSGLREKDVIIQIDNINLEK